ncbi:CASP-like protein 1F1 [Typha angustifolia]|uniref:CASP-like protein 1F1 n=1 Tax=Typha angustifolia TaxID=59011 RepID=UPI003C2F4E04
MDQEAETKSIRKKYVVTHVILRIIASVFALAAALIMRLNRETAEVIPGIFVKASFKQSTAFEFFLVGNAVACGYSLVTLPFVSNLADGYVLHLFDLMIMSLLMASASAATAIGHLAKVGNDDIGWSKVCPYYEKFCNRAGISLVLSYIGFLFFLGICAMAHVHKTRRAKLLDHF